MDINQGEIEKLYQWASNNFTNEIEVKYFTKIDKECVSYFEKRPFQSEYGKEYRYQTMPELRSELNAMWKDDDIMKQILKTVLVASMKNKPKMQENGQENKEENIKQLKPFIYNF